MNYYVMLGGQQKGPYTLDQLVELGIRPDTYVWCKGMADWQHADEVADICRAFRLHIVDIRHPKRLDPNQSNPQPEAPENNNNEFRPLFDPAEPNPSAPLPRGMLPVAIIVTLFCFFPTGLASIYYAVKARKAWNESRNSLNKNNSQLYDREEREQLARDLSDSIRYYKMWTGITFFLGIISLASIISF